MTEADGYKLELSHRFKSGYRGVYTNQATGRYFVERGQMGKKNYKYLGAFDSAVDGAVAYARSKVEEIEKEEEGGKRSGTARGEG